jgi:hypothetical protein
MLTRFALLIGLSVIFTGCVTNKQYGLAENLPDSEVVIFEKLQYGRFNDSRFNSDYIVRADYIDGNAFSATTLRRLPGIHTLGIQVDWGFCFGIFPSGCFNRCYSGITLKAEAGRKYSYDIERINEQVYMTLLDNTGKVVTKGNCEKCSWGVCGPGQVRSINERIEKESKKLEMQNNLE